tara:strand:- start:863 stop:3754 length:2892 start_codon:yes stop_codon:yes gene_type:complete
MIKKEWENIIIPDWIKSLDKELILEIKELSSIKRFKAGTILSNKENIQSEVFFILNGNARLTYNYNFDFYTINKLKKNDWVGLISYLRNSPIEEVISITDIKLLCIPDKLIIKIINFENPKFTIDIQLVEVIDLIVKFNKSENKDFSRIIEASKQLISNIKLKNNLNKYDDKDNIYLLGSNNVEQKSIGDQINPFDLRKKYIKKIDLRLLEINKNRFYEILDDIKIDIYSNENNTSLLPLPSAINLGGLKNKEFYMKGDGPFEEGLACLKMICKMYNVKFSYESLEQLLIEKLSKKNNLTLSILGEILLQNGFIVGEAYVNRNNLLRLKKNSLVFYKEHISIVRESNIEKFVLISPKLGKLVLKKSDLKNSFPEINNILIPKRSIKSNIKKFGINWIIPFFKKYRNIFIKLLLASFVVQLLSLANPLLIQVIIDKVISQRSLNTLQIIGVALFLVTIFESILRSLRTFLLVDTTNRIDLDLGSEVISHLFKLPLTFFSKRRVGELSTKISELEKIRDFFTGQTLTTIIDALFSIIYIFIMIVYSWLLTLIALSVLPIQILITLLGAPLFKNQYRKVAESNANTQNHLIESMNVIQTIKTQNIENNTFKKWVENYSNFIQKIFNKTITGTILTESSSLLQKISQIIVLWVGASMVLKGQLTLGQLIAFRIISGYVTQPILRLSSLSQRFEELKVSFERLGDVINQETESNFSDKNNISMPEIRGQIKYHNVDYAYQENGNKILDNINIEFKDKSLIGIVGRSGSGKSTFVKLLARLYKPNNGKIYIDDIDIQKVELISLRKQIGFVSQEPNLLTGTVLENIGISDPETNKSEIIDAAKMACAHEFIMNLENGYSTKIEEKGGSLSGGQKQRIAIARALVNKPRILILDEATSALDFITEKDVLRNIYENKENCTVIFVTHRITNLLNMEKIILMSNGQIAEEGNFSELIKKRGLFYAMSIENKF